MSRSTIDNESTGADSSENKRNNNEKINNDESNASIEERYNKVSCELH